MTVPPLALLFQSAFEHAAIGMALVSPTGRWLRVNRSVCELVGYSEAELLACSFQDITHPDDLDLDLEHVHRLLRGAGDNYQMEKRYLHRRGHVVWVQLSVSMVREADGRPLLFISQLQDITARKEAEHIRDILFALPNVMHFVAGFDGYFKRLSASWSHLLGYSIEELMAQPYLHFVHPEDRGRTTVEADALSSNGRLSLFENRYRHADGTYRWILWTSNPRPEEQLIYGAALDYTDRKLEQLQLASTLQEKEGLLAELHSSTAEIQKLQRELLTVCAWTKRIRYLGEWMSADDFLRKHLQLRLTHGISEEAAAQIMKRAREDG